VVLLSISPFLAIFIVINYLKTGLVVFSLSKYFSVFFASSTILGDHINSFLSLPIAVNLTVFATEILFIISDSSILLSVE
jgi:hypothetical protein